MNNWIVRLSGDEAREQILGVGSWDSWVQSESQWKLKNARGRMSRKNRRPDSMSETFSFTRFSSRFWIWTSNNKLYDNDKTTIWLIFHPNIGSPPLTSAHTISQCRRSPSKLAKKEIFSCRNFHFSSEMRCHSTEITVTHMTTICKTNDFECNCRWCTATCMEENPQKSSTINIISPLQYQLRFKAVVEIDFIFFADFWDFEIETESAGVWQKQTQH